MSQPLDPIDTIATKAFEGYVVRKDLVRKFKGQYPVPTYVAEFLLGRYCASVEDEEIFDGLKIVERQLGEKTIRAGEHELFKARAKNKGQEADRHHHRLIGCRHRFVFSHVTELATQGRADQ
jgi:ATP-dependent Lon protease